MAFLAKMVLDVCVNRGEFLQRFHLSESQHGALSSSEWQVAVLGPVIEPAAHLAAVEIAELAHRGRV